MAKEEIKKLLENSKAELDNDSKNSIKSIQDDLKSFKNKTLNQI